MNDMISELELNGFKVRGNKILKKSSRSGRWETAGSYNSDDTAYFYAQNSYPYASGVKIYPSKSGTLIDHKDIQPIKRDIPKENIIEFNIDLIDSITENNDNLSKFLNNVSGGGNLMDLYGIRCIKEGGLKGGTLFPYIDYNNALKTGKIIKYNTTTGKRIKNAYSTNWLHTEKTILESLKQDKGSNKVDCFFGEHLINGNSKPIVIVESEKTAFVLSLIYTNINFIATGGLHFFKKQIENLKEKMGEDFNDLDIYVFADCLVNEWVDIAEDNNLIYVEVLDVLEQTLDVVKQGDDVVDFILPILQGDDITVEAYRYIDKSLTAIGIGSDEYNLVLTELNDLRFRWKKDTTFNDVVMTVTSGDDNDIAYRCAYSWDNSNIVGGSSYEYEYFTFYDNEFQSITANVDINDGIWSKQYKKKVRFNPSNFYAELKRLFIILQELNKGYNEKDDVRELFRNILIRINRFSGYSFNYEFVMGKYDDWVDEHQKDLKNTLNGLCVVLNTSRKKLIVKTRDWEKNKEIKMKDDEFLTKLNEERKLHKIHTILINQISEAIKNNPLRPIMKKELNLCSRTHKEIAEMVDNYNISLTGGKTEPHLNNYNAIFDYVEECTFYDTSYSDVNIVCQDLCTFKFPSQKAIMDSTNIKNKRAVSKIVKAMKGDYNEAKSIANQFIYLLRNPTSFEIERIVSKQKEKTVNCLDEDSATYKKSVNYNETRLILKPVFDKESKRNDEIKEMVSKMIEYYEANKEEEIEEEIDTRTFDEYFEDTPTNDVWLDWKWTAIRNGEEYLSVNERNTNHELQF